MTQHPIVTRVHVDFTQRDGRRITTSTSAADDPGKLAIGTRVGLWDDEGNTDAGIVTDITRDGMVAIRILRGHWVSHEMAESPGPKTPTRGRVGCLMGLLGFAVIGFGFFLPLYVYGVVPGHDRYNPFGEGAPEIVCGLGVLLLAIGKKLLGAPENTPPRPSRWDRDEPNSEP